MGLVDAINQNDADSQSLDCGRPASSAPKLHLVSMGKDDAKALEAVYRHMAQSQTLEDIADYFKRLSSENQRCWLDCGGDILEAIVSVEENSARVTGYDAFHDQAFSPKSTLTAQPSKSLQADFDKRYLTMIQLIATADIALARNIHARAKAICSIHAQSWIRYCRIATALDSISNGLDYQRSAGARIATILPAVAASPSHRCLLSEFKQSLESVSSSHAKTLTIELHSVYCRTCVEAVHDCDASYCNKRWIDPLDLTALDSFDLHTLPSVRICHSPTNIAYKQSNEYRYRYRGSDIFHYFRMTSRAGFMPVTRHLQQAYFLPRIGARNHYHSLVDKIPALFGYQLLQLTCPIVSTYELDDTERYFCSLLGVDPDTIIVDALGELVADTGMVPDCQQLRLPFFEYCKSLDVALLPTVKRIYISRSRSRDRKLCNEESVHALMLRKGLQIIHMEDYELEQQIAIAQQAELIVGPHGAGLANIVFAAPGTRVIELIPDRYMTPLFKQLAADNGQRYSPVVGRTHETDDIQSPMHWSINLKRLECVMDAVTDELS